MQVAGSSSDGGGVRSPSYCCCCHTSPPSSSTISPFSISYSTVRLTGNSGREVVLAAVMTVVAVTVLVAFERFFRFIVGGETVFAFFGVPGHGRTLGLGFRFGEN
ncbi:hypothetical protein HanXRQr2_Chr06g0258801 [Helianthus annuus]|uniref:Uncharacterized protein n=1 Tax=Helianthus annuus TaxID=4232 RepID=A0A9K3IUR5_HELAN|nr:hypothetical protein HanXRQr2_Chr06g0258801 [Helianthus annuus]KAJ0915437.1 hypothetical protein HanPSC8_Chr06g0249831 [Helianthus annuus]